MEFLQNIWQWLIEDFGWKLTLIITFIGVVFKIIQFFKKNEGIVQEKKQQINNQVGINNTQNNILS